MDPSDCQLRFMQDSAEIFGQVKDSLRRGGRPIPVNVVWIASQDLEAGAQVITSDRHFNKVNGLILWEKI